jgi:hypothetical protein
VIQAGNAIRVHESHSHNGLELKEYDQLAEAVRREVAPEVVASFDAAQAAWDA